MIHVNARLFLSGPSASLRMHRLILLASPARLRHAVKILPEQITLTRFLAYSLSLAHTHTLHTRTHAYLMLMFPSLLLLVRPTPPPP